MCKDGMCEHHTDHNHMSNEAHEHDMHQHSTGMSLNRMAASATLHCLTGCAIGEVAGLVIGTLFGLGTLQTIILATLLAFIFGFRSEEHHV